VNDDRPEIGPRWLYVFAAVAVALGVLALLGFGLLALLLREASHAMAGM
jgi:hypothetical protein